MPATGVTARGYSAILPATPTGSTEGSMNRGLSSESAQRAAPLFTLQKWISSGKSRPGSALGVVAPFPMSSRRLPRVEGSRLNRQRDLLFSHPPAQEGECAVNSRFVRDID